MKVYFVGLSVICMLVSATGWTADTAACIACHNDKMVANPILDGQHAKYIEKQLQDLKKDLRIHAQMQGIAKTLDDKQIADLSIKKDKYEALIDGKRCVIDKICSTTGFVLACCETILW